jgi:hypothetical protein
MRCSKGDLAVVIHAARAENLGRIVRIAWADNGKSGLSFQWAGPTWWVDAKGGPMLWRVGGDWLPLQCGPIPDEWLQPIHGNSYVPGILFQRRI